MTMKIRLMGACLLLLLAISACKFQSPAKLPVTTATVKKKAAVIVDSSICIAAVGDIMLGTSYPTAATLPADSGRHSFDAALPDLRNADVTMGNLEGTLLDSGNPAHYKMHLLSKAYLFRMPTYYSAILKSAGFKVLSLANNHLADFGERGRTSTMHVLDSANINYGGQISHPTSVFTVKGVRYGFCAFAPNAQTLPILDLENTASVIRELKTRCDIVIVSFHGGGEGPAFEHVTGNMERYIGERRGNVLAFAHTAIDAGADMVLGNGPHVNRAMELYKNRIIAYSLGNFCTYRCVSVEGVCGLSSLLKIHINRKGEFLRGQLLAFKQTHAEGLMRDSTNRVIARIKYLTETDFPQSGLQIGNDGMITALPQQIKTSEAIN